MSTESTQNGDEKRRLSDSNDNLKDEILNLKVQLQDFIAQTAAEREKIRKNRNISYFVAENVSVVGLREVLTLNHTPLKVIWAVLVLGGLAATIYYIYTNTYEYLNKEPATKVSLQRSTAYDIPPLILCPPWFFDTTEVNLSTNAIRYSLGYADFFYTYLDDLDSFFPNLSAMVNTSEMMGNLEDARDTFYSFYERNNFSSMQDYYSSIATDIYFVTSEERHSVQMEGGSLQMDECRGCNQSQPPEKVLFGKALCYVFHLNKATPKSAEEPVYIRMSNTENTNGIIPRSKNDWLMDFMSNVGPGGPSIPLKAYSSYNVKLSAQRMIQLVNASNCVDTEADPGYNQRLCAERCLSYQTYSEVPICKGHTSFAVTRNLTEIRNMADYLIRVFKIGQSLPYDNFQTAVNETNGAFSQFNASKQNEQSDQLKQAFAPNDTVGQINDLNGTLGINETARKTPLENAVQVAGPSDEALLKCYQDCLPPCDRLIYDITIDHSSISNEEHQENKSVIELYIRHSAVFQGGIIVWQEVTTLTFGDFVSNVGGTLGLFLGCTVLTLAQLVLSFVSYCLDQRAQKNRNCDRPTVAMLVPVKMA